MVLTEGTGQVGIEVPRDRDGRSGPQIVKKRQRRLNGVDEIVLSLYAKGLTTGEISAHFAEIYGASVSKETISRITDRVIEEMQAWAARPLDEVYAAVFIDAIVVKVRDGQVASRPVYAAIGVTLAGEKDILGLQSGTGGEGAKFWMSVLADLKSGEPMWWMRISVVPAHDPPTRPSFARNSSIILVLKSLAPGWSLPWVSSANTDFNVDFGGLLPRGAGTFIGASTRAGCRRSWP